MNNLGLPLHSDYIWSGPSLDEMNWENAVKFATRMGGRLPTKEDIVARRHDFGGRLPSYNNTFWLSDHVNTGLYHKLYYDKNLLQIGHMEAFHHVVYIIEKQNQVGAVSNIQTELKNIMCIHPKDQVVHNSANGEHFKYCRKCKSEVT